MIEVLDAKTRPCGRFGRKVSWNLEVLLSSLPDHQDYRYDRRKLSSTKTLYYALLDGVASFYIEDKHNDKGYDGRVFDTILTTGESVLVKGPWSSSASFVNSLSVYPEKLISVSATESATDWKRGFTFYALSGITETLAKQALRFLPDWHIQFNDKASNAETNDQQNAVITGDLRGELVYGKEYELCDKCNGDGYLPASKEDERSFLRHNDKRYYVQCKSCPNWLLWGLKPVPGVRWPTTFA